MRMPKIPMPLSLSTEPIILALKSPLKKGRWKGKEGNECSNESSRAIKERQKKERRVESTVHSAYMVNSQVVQFLHDLPYMTSAVDGGPKKAIKRNKIG